MNELRALEGLTVAELRLFSRVVGLQSFSAAAREARVSQSSVSRLVATMEARLGAPLLVRTTRRATPTTLGERLVQALEGVLETFRAPDGGPTERGLRGSLRVAAPGAFGRAFVAPVANQFLREHPGAELELQLSDRRIDLVQHRIDLAVRIGSLSPGVRARVLGASEQMLVCAPALVPARPPETLAALAADGPVPVVMAATHDLRGLKALGLKAGMVRVRLVCDDLDSLFSAAVDGVGMTMLPRWRAQRALDDGVLVRLLPRLNFPSAPVRAVFAGSGRPGPLARAFTDLLARSLPATLRTRG
jgi:DNA-binding transcriptional LysR family regulator